MHLLSDRVNGKKQLMPGCLYNHFSRGNSGRQNKSSPYFHGEGREQAHKSTNELIANCDREYEGNKPGDSMVSTGVWLESI